MVFWMGGGAGAYRARGRATRVGQQLSSLLNAMKSQDPA